MFNYNPVQTFLYRTTNRLKRIKYLFVREITMSRNSRFFVTFPETKVTTKIKQRWVYSRYVRRTKSTEISTGLSTDTKSAYQVLHKEKQRIYQTLHEIKIPFITWFLYHSCLHTDFCQQFHFFFPGFTLAKLHKTEVAYIISPKLKQSSWVCSNYLYATIRDFIT